MGPQKQVKKVLHKCNISSIIFATKYLEKAQTYHYYHLLLSRLHLRDRHLLQILFEQMSNEWLARWDKMA